MRGGAGSRGRSAGVEHRLPRPLGERVGVGLVHPVHVDRRLDGDSDHMGAANHQRAGSPGLAGALEQDRHDRDAGPLCGHEGPGTEVGHLVRRELALRKDDDRRPLVEGPRGLLEGGAAALAVAGSTRMCWQRRGAAESVDPRAVHGE